MGKLFMLVKNELIKLLKRKSIPVMFLVTVVIALGVALLYNFSRCCSFLSNKLKNN